MSLPCQLRCPGLGGSRQKPLLPHCPPLPHTTQIAQAPLFPSSSEPCSTCIRQRWRRGSIIARAGSERAQEQQSAQAVETSTAAPIVDAQPQAGASGQAGTPEPEPGSATPHFTQTSPWKELSALLASIAAFLWSVVNSIRQFPAWAHAQQLKKLRDLSDEDPKNADKHAAYLAELNKSQPKEVLARVESKEVGLSISSWARAPTRVSSPHTQHHQPST